MRFPDRFLRDMHMWADHRLGTDPRAALSHLKREADEAIEAVDWLHKLRADGQTEGVIRAALAQIRDELADIQTLLLRAAHCCGIDPETLVGDTIAKHRVVRTRQWSEPDSEGVRHHIEDADSLWAPGHFVVCPGTPFNQHVTQHVTRVVKDGDREVPECVACGFRPSTEPEPETARPVECDCNPAPHPDHLKRERGWTRCAKCGTEYPF